MPIMPLLAKASAIAAGTVLVTAGIAYSGGVVEVCVKEKTGHGSRNSPSHIHLPLPALAGPLALHLIPAHRLESPRDLHQWMPVIRAAAEELERCPDAELVSVVNARETVHILKRGSDLVIDVDSERETVHVSFPIRTAVAMAEQLESAGPSI